MNTINEVDTISYIRRAYEAWSGGACNPIALAKFLSEFTLAHRDLGSEALAKHVVMRLVLAQLSYLAGIGIGDCNNADKEAEAILLSAGIVL